MSMEVRFNPTLVVLSVLVAIFASYVALNLAHSVTQAKGRAKAIWLSSGALAMGVGIWSMHFVGMLAFEMPGMEMGYDIPLMILSVVVAIAASALALFIISRSVVPTSSILAGGVAMAAAIAGMHYIGMYSMRMDAVIHWNIFLVVLSVIIALVASYGAILISIRLRNKTDRFLEMLLASIVMGFAISGMHYTGMIAATFVHANANEVAQSINSSDLLVSSGLAMAVISTTLLVLGLALATSIGQRLWDLRNKKVKRILVESEEKFRHLVDAVKDYAIFMLSLKGTITTWNSGAERITGYSEKEIIGKHISTFYAYADKESQEADRELKITAERGHFEAEVQRRRKDGSTYWANVVINPLYDQDKNITGFSKVIRDITQFKESERRLRLLNEELENRVDIRTKALEQCETQLRTITNAAPILMAEVDRYEKVLFANEAFAKWFQESLSSVIGKTFRELLGEQRYAENESHIKKALSGEVVTYERQSTAGDVTAILGITFVPEFDSSGPAGFIIVASDITKHKEIQDELQKAKEAAEVANTTKSAFLANMSHEIRTPLGAVLGFSELLLDSQISPSERANCVEVIKRNGQLLSNIINDILDLSKVEAGKLRVERVAVPFAEVMNEIGSALNLEATEKGIDLKVSSEGLIPSQITTDPLRLRQILLNIVGNAIKFTKRGSVDVKVKLIAVNNKTNQLAFIVKDTGEGIKADQIARLFTPFTQADVSTTRKFGGTGLGLVLSKKLAVALGGDLQLTETSPGKGSTFTITIDPGLSDQVLFQSSAVSLSVAPSNLINFENKKAAVNLSLMKILVVDDSHDNQALLMRILSFTGASVAMASNGREAVEKALDGDFSLILMDLQMPEMDGYEATKLLRSQGYQKPIIALTAHAMKEERQRTMSSGFNDHITKPIDLNALVKTLASYSI